MDVQSSSEEGGKCSAITIEDSGRVEAVLGREEEAETADRGEEVVVEEVEQQAREEEGAEDTTTTREIEEVTEEGTEEVTQSAEEGKQGSVEAAEGEEMDKERVVLDQESQNSSCSAGRRMCRFIPEPLRSNLRPPLSCREWLEFAMIKLPIIQMIWTYRLDYIVGDVVAGVTVAILHVPQGLAYALLANVPPVFGLYTAFIAPLLYALVGTSRHLSVGSFAVVQLIVGNSVESMFVSFKDELENCSMSGDGLENNHEVFFRGENTTCFDVKSDTVITLAFMAGIIMFGMGVLMMGFINIFLSEPLVSGYTTGAAMHVFNSQLQHITGLGSLISTPPGLFRIPKTWIALLKNIGSINWPTLIVSIVAILALVIFRVVNSCLLSPRVRLPMKIYKRRERKWVTRKCSWPLPIPAALIVIIVAAVIAYYGRFQERFDVAPVGTIPDGLPGTTVPRVGLMPYLIEDAFVVAIITYSVSVSIARVAAKDFGYKINSNQEFLAFGLTNIIGSFFNSFSSSASLSRSSLQMSSGGKTQVASILASCIVLVVLLKLGSLVEPLPKAILASLIWVSLINMFKKFKDCYTYSKLSLWDGAVWIVVFLATTLLGVDFGLGVGVGFSLVIILFRIILPTSSTYQQNLESHEGFSDIDDSRMMISTQGIRIFRFNAPLCFINCNIFRQKLEKACKIYTSSNIDWETEGCIQTLLYKIGIMKRKVKSQNGSVLRENGCFRPDVIHTVIIDGSSINFMDSVAVSSLEKIIDEFGDEGILVLIANMSDANVKMLQKSKFLQNQGKEHLYPTVFDALKHTHYEAIVEPASASNYQTIVEHQQHPHNTIDSCSTGSSET